MAERPLTQIEGRVVCARCGTAIVVCSFCESETCRNVICYRCLRRELAQSLVQPHTHGG